MKKMLFSAIALVAFTAISMAGEIPAEKEIKSETPCADQWVRDMKTLQGDYWGASFEEALAIADQCFEQCLVNTYGSN